MCSWISTPSSAATRASSRASRAGCTSAQPSRSQLAGQEDRAVDLASHGVARPGSPGDPRSQSTWCSSTATLSMPVRSSWQSRPRSRTSASRASRLSRAEPLEHVVLVGPAAAPVLLAVGEAGLAEAAVAAGRRPPDRARLQQHHPGARGCGASRAPRSTARSSRRRPRSGRRRCPRSAAGTTCRARPPARTPRAGSVRARRRRRLPEGPGARRRSGQPATCASPALSASSRIARPSRASSSLIVHGGTRWIRLVLENGSSPADLHARDHVVEAGRAAASPSCPGRSPGRSPRTRRRRGPRRRTRAARRSRRGPGPKTSRPRRVGVLDDALVAHRVDGRDRGRGGQRVAGVGEPAGVGPVRERRRDRRR